MPPRKQRKHSKQQELQHNTDQDSAVLILAEAKAEPKELFVKESLFSILPLSETLSGKHGILHIVILAVILLVAVFLPMHSEMTHNQAAIKDLVARVEIIESAPKQQLTQEQLKSILSMAQLQEKELPVATQVSEPVAEPSDTPDKIVHHYTPPANPERRYTYDDFQSYWNITALHTVTFPPEIDAVLATREIKNDAYYNVNPAYFDDFEKKYCTYISAGSHEYEERVMMHVKWSGPAIGYGVFASMDIPADVPIGVYTGVVTLHTKNTDYVHLVNPGLVILYKIRRGC